MRILGLAAGAVALIVTSANADVTAPGDVNFDNGVVAASLTGVAGDPDSGRSVFAGRKLGNCLACHVNSDMPEESFHGEVGPPIDGVADRWNEDEMRAILVDSKMVFDGTIMPGFYQDDGFERPLEKFQGKTILTAQQVEDVIAYLQTLKEE